jgi:hypothetical protein
MTTQMLRRSGFCLAASDTPPFENGKEVMQQLLFVLRNPFRVPLSC